MYNIIITYYDGGFYVYTRIFDNALQISANLSTTLLSIWVWRVFLSHEYLRRVGVHNSTHERIWH